MRRRWGGGALTIARGEYDFNFEPGVLAAMINSLSENTQQKPRTPHVLGVLILAQDNAVVHPAQQSG
jgi:hypothetical protein